MPYSMVISGDVYDIVFTKQQNSAYTVWAKHGQNTKILLGTVYKLPFGWTAVLGFRQPHALPSVNGFITRWKAREYLVNAYQHEGSAA